ncbi:MAG: hypothetical protein II837_02905 [Treponema sp.]|nr:hypothetical protein [Treponema sp.]
MKFVGKIYKDAWGWWNETDVEKVVWQTLETWGWIPDNWKEIWQDELVALVNGSA